MIGLRDLPGPGLPGRTGLMDPDRAQLHVVAVLSDAQLAFGAGAHERSLDSFAGAMTTRPVLYTSRGGPVTDGCLFCRIVVRESPADIVYENDEVLVFKDPYPKAPIHFLIVPKRHIESLAIIEPPDTEVLGRCLLVARALGEQVGYAERGYRVSCNCGPEG